MASSSRLKRWFTSVSFLWCRPHCCLGHIPFEPNLRLGTQEISTNSDADNPGAGGGAVGDAGGGLSLTGGMSSDSGTIRWSAYEE